MTMFDARSMHSYCANLRRFLRMSHEEFLIKAGLPPRTRSGKPRRYPESAVEYLESLVNGKAAECESQEVGFDRRLRISMDYVRMSDAALGRAVGVSRSAVSNWTSGKCHPSERRTELIAQALGIPAEWLAAGGAERLPADSHIGVRVGTEALFWRTELKAITHDLVGGEANEIAFNERVEQLCVSSDHFRVVARRAGGRWLLLGDELVLAHWHPLEPEGLQRRYWPDDLEEKLDELSSQEEATMISVWRQLKDWCGEMGYDCPKPITLYQRARKRREHQKRFGYLFEQQV